MDGSTPAWLTALISIGTLLAGGFGAWLLSVYQAAKKSKLDADAQKGQHELAKDKQLSEARMSENEQAFKIYKELVDNLRSDVMQMTKNQDKLEEDHLHCREENAALKAEIRSLSREIEEIKKLSPK